MLHGMKNRPQANYEDGVATDLLSWAENGHHIHTIHANKTSRYKNWLHSPAWAVSTVLLSLVVISQNIHSMISISKPLGSYQTGFVTDFEEARSAITTTQLRFTSPIRAFANGSLYFVAPGSEPHYVSSTGASFEEVDKAWDDLLWGRYVNLELSEVSWLESLSPAQNLSHIDIPGRISAGIYGGPDMLHSLHCLNALRKHLDLDYYESRMDLPKQYRRMHIDHCVDQLRQAVLCHGDMTPVTLKAVRANGRWAALLGETEHLHTCRNGANLRQWWLQRGDRSGRIEGMV